MTALEHAKQARKEAGTRCGQLSGEGAVEEVDAGACWGVEFPAKSIFSVVNEIPRRAAAVDGSRREQPHRRLSWMDLHRGDRVIDSVQLRLLHRFHSRL